MKNTMRGCSAYCPADHNSCQSARCDSFLSTVELHLSGLTGKASRPDMQKIRIIGIFFENRLNWHFEKFRLFLFTVIVPKPFYHAKFEVLEAIKL